jgi:hypothetical protein
MTRGIRLQSLADVRRFTAKTINQVYKNQITIEQGRCLGYLLSILASVIRDSDLEQRIEKLEKQAGLKK